MRGDYDQSAGLRAPVEEAPQRRRTPQDLWLGEQLRKTRGQEAAEFCQLIRPEGEEDSGGVQPPAGQQPRIIRDCLSRQLRC